ncbi:MAG: hypothetical protein IPN18_05060 [Ignavibacteriales bacterium]|nr:hypothetical protein [Ignavibacteriales bacterium]
MTNGRKINEIAVPDVNTIYGACDSSRIVMSKDGGATWTEFEAGLGTTNQFIAIDFINTQYGMATGSNGNIMKTVNGGANWTLVNLPTTTLAWDIDVIDTSFAFICGTGETIFRTTDGGTTWVQQFGAGGTRFIRHLFLLTEMLVLHQALQETLIIPQTVVKPGLLQQLCLTTLFGAQQW